MESWSDPESRGETSPSITRRRLILRDTITFLSLTFLTIVLSVMTLVLFRSFAAHRAELGKRWSDRGRAALIAGKPEQAIESLRTALVYVPAERSYELLLAQALADAGHTDEAFNYFSGLWDAEPGSGIINLQLARLAAAKNKSTEAVNFYRASIYGTWEGDGVARRRDVRFELTRYLLQRGDSTAARAELLVIEGNTESDSVLDLEIGNLFHQAGDIADALEAYSKASEADPKDPAPLAAAGRLAFSIGRFTTAQHLLQQAVRAEEAAGKQQQPEWAGLADLLRKSDRILEIFPSQRLSPNERATRLLALRTLAKKRLDGCATTLPGLPPLLKDLNARWSAGIQGATRKTLLQNQSLQDDLLQWIYETETRTDQACSPASGDDALLVQMYRFPKAVDQ